MKFNTLKDSMFLLNPISSDFKNKNYDALETELERALLVLNQGRQQTCCKGSNTDASIIHNLMGFF